VTLQEPLGARLQDLEVTDGMDGLIVRPRRYLGKVWAEDNMAVRAPGALAERPEPSRRLVANTKVKTVVVIATERSCISIWDLATNGRR
jgi:hypothetical protein